MAKIRRGRALIPPPRAPLIGFTHCHPTRSTSMQTFAKLALAAGVSALGLGAVLPVQAADMGYPEAQTGYPAPPPGYYPPPAQQGYYPPPPPPAAYGYPPPPPVEYGTYIAPPYVVAPGPYYGPGPYWRSYGPRYAYGYGHWRGGYRRW